MIFKKTQENEKMSHKFRDSRNS